MGVLVGSARQDENGRYSNGKPGDQTTKEVTTQNWYLHKKGWTVARAKDPAVAVKIAYAMKAACDNQNIGYAQDTRNGLYNAVKNKGYDPAKCTEKVNTDCSALVRICVCYSGVIVGNFNTANEISVLKATGKFDILEDAKYTNKSTYLKTGDILVTKTKGHTVVVINDGDNVEPSSKEVYYIVKLGDTLSRIAKNYNTTVKNILALNPDIKDPNKIRVNQKIRVS